MLHFNVAESQSDVWTTEFNDVLILAQLLQQQHCPASPGNLVGWLIKCTQQTECMCANSAVYVTSAKLEEYYISAVITYHGPKRVQTTGLSWYLLSLQTRFPGLVFNNHINSACTGEDTLRLKKMQLLSQVFSF